MIKIAVSMILELVNVYTENASLNDPQHFVIRFDGQLYADVSKRSNNCSRHTQVRNCCKEDPDWVQSFTSNPRSVYRVLVPHAPIYNLYLPVSNLKSNKIEQGGRTWKRVQTNGIIMQAYR